MQSTAFGVRQELTKLKTFFLNVNQSIMAEKSDATITNVVFSLFFFPIYIPNNWIF